MLDEQKEVNKPLLDDATAARLKAIAPDEERKRGRPPISERPLTGAERQRKYRNKNAPPKEIENFSQISEDWTRNEKQLLATDPKLHANLLALHNAIMGWEAEADEIAEGVKNGLRAETRSAETAESTEIFPMPDDSFHEIKAVALKRGTANYRQVEADAINGRVGDNEEYIRYGFRLRIQSDTLQNARENLVLYALRTHDQNLNWQIVEEAITDCCAYRPRFSPNAEELQRLIQEHRVVDVQV